MDFSEEQDTSDVQNTLPQFSELTSRPSQIGTTSTSGGNLQSQAVQTSVYAIAASTSQKQVLMNSSAKYTAPILTWTDPSALFQLYEKQGIQGINISNYGQNNTMLSVQPNSLPTNIISSMYLPSVSQAEAVKQETDNQSEEQKNAELESQSQFQQHSAAVAEYLQKLQATTLPITTLQQLIKLQTEQVKKEKVEEEKMEHPQNNILNIPSVPAFRNQLQNGGNFINADQMMVSINPSDLNVHMEDEQENESNLQPAVVKVEQQIQTDSPKIEKRPKFRAKVGEIKISVTLDGSVLYSCPECNLGYPDKAGIDQHINAHIQERKYQCKECGAMLKRKEHLDQHMRGHSDERPFKCPMCEKAFKRNEHLTRHYVIHSGNKNFLCHVCQKAFSRKDHLNKHAQTHLGIRKSKVKKDIFYFDQKDSLDKNIDIAAVPKQEISYFWKDGCLLKQETTFLQHIQNLQKDPNLLHTFSSFKEQMLKDASALQQQNVSTNENLPQNTKYLMPS